MVININPNRINLPSRQAGKTPDRANQASDNSEVIIPVRAHVNFIPSPEALRTLVAGAVDALRQGVRWDRGTILNLLV